MSKKRFDLLSDAQWELIAPLLPEPARRKDKRGRPWAPNRACLEGILWVLQTGAAWPSEYARWLSGDRVPIDLLRPFDAEAMTATCVDPGTAVTAQEASLFDSI
jgi:hypothetical protein